MAEREANDVALRVTHIQDGVDYSKTIKMNYSLTATNDADFHSKQTLQQNFIGRHTSKNCDILLLLNLQIYL